MDPQSSPKNSLLEESKRAEENSQVGNASLLTSLIEVITQQNEIKEIELAVQSLIAAKVNVNELDAREMTPIYHAAHRGYEGVVRMLIEADADVNAPNDSGVTPVYAAARQGHETVITALANADADVNTPDKEGATPIYIAAMYGHSAAITALIDAGASSSINLRCNGQTPYMIAHEMQNTEAMEALEEAGADTFVILQSEPGEYTRISQLPPHILNKLNPLTAKNWAAFTPNMQQDAKKSEEEKLEPKTSSPSLKSTDRSVP